MTAIDNPFSKLSDEELGEVQAKIDADQEVFLAELARVVATKGDHSATRKMAADLNARQRALSDERIRRREAAANKP